MTTLKKSSTAISMVMAVLLSVVLVGVWGCNGQSADSGTPSDAPSPEDMISKSPSRLDNPEVITEEFNSVLLENGYVKVEAVAKSYVPVLGNYGYDLVIKNKTDKRILVGATDVSVGGEHVNTYWTADVPASGTAESRMSFIRNIGSLDQLKNVEGRIIVNDFAEVINYSDNGFKVN